MVKRLRRSARPIVEISIPSIRILPSVASTNLKKDSANVLLPDPVLPRIPTWQQVGYFQQYGKTTHAFSPGCTSKLMWWRTSGNSGWKNTASIWMQNKQDVHKTNRVTNNKVLAFDFPMRRPGRIRSWFHKLGRFTLEVSVFFNSLHSNLDNVWWCLIDDKGRRTMDCSRATNRRTIHKRSMVIVEANDRANPAKDADTPGVIRQTSPVAPTIPADRRLKRTDNQRFTATQISMGLDLPHNSNYLPPHIQ